MPPQLLALAAIGLGLYAGFRLAVRAAETLRSQPPRASPEPATTATAGGEPRDLGRLDWDEAAGVYKPRKG